MTEKTKQEIISYCDYVYNKHIKKKELDLYEVPHSYFMELLYRTCVEEFKESGSHLLFQSKIANIIAVLQDSEKIFNKFKNKEVQLVGIDNSGLLHFNNNLENTLKYNKTLNEWQIIEALDKNKDNG